MEIFAKQGDVIAGQSRPFRTPRESGHRPQWHHCLWLLLPLLTVTQIGKLQVHRLCRVCRASMRWSRCFVRARGQSDWIGL